MTKISGLLLVVMVCLGEALAAPAPVEVLYVTETEGKDVALITYNVNPETAATTEAGAPMQVGASNIDAVTVNGQHLIYVWNSKDVWMYTTNAEGVPASEASQHLKLNLTHPVVSFAVDPDGKFAYAGMAWVGTGYNNYAALALFTIDPSTGKLTNANRTAARYGPNLYVGLTGFFFRAGGERLYANFFDDGPYTCIDGYNFYPVDETSGALGGLMPVTYGEADCQGASGLALTDTVTASASACCGQGSGGVFVYQIFTGQEIGCGAPTFCGDDVAQLNLDPASENLFYGDSDTGITYIGHLNFPGEQLIETASTIAGTPKLFFSPDSRLVYALNAGDIGIYTLQSSSGTLGANSSVTTAGQVNITTVTLP